MDVAVTTLRAELSSWIDHVKEGGEVVITERGLPVARLVPVGARSLIEQLTEQGIISKPLSDGKPRASRPRVRAKGPGQVSDLIAENRR